jgi:hypothetical protein
MISRWTAAAALCGGSAIFAINLGAGARNAPPFPVGQASGPTIGQAPLYDPHQLPAQRGQVLQFTLTPRGVIDGLILADGTEVKTPPHLSTEIAYCVKPGDTVTIHGLRAAALPLVQAVSITDDQIGRTVIDDGPLGPARGLSAPPPPTVLTGGRSAGLNALFSGLTEAKGRVRMSLHGPQGELNGALLVDGTVLRLPPPQAYRFATLLQPGETLVAEGVGLATPIGRVLEVQQIGASRQELSLVETPPGSGRSRRPPEPPGPEFAPPGSPRP